MKSTDTRGSEGRKRKKRRQEEKKEERLSLLSLFASSLALSHAYPLSDQRSVKNRNSNDTKGPLRGLNDDAVGTKCSEKDKEKCKVKASDSLSFFLGQCFPFFSTTYKARSEGGTFAGSAPVERRRGPGLVAVEIGSGDKQAGQLR